MAGIPFSAIFTYVALIRTFFKTFKQNVQEDFDEILEGSQPVASGTEDDFEEAPNMSSMGIASVAIALAVLGGKAKSFRSDLGLPEEGTAEFEKMKPEFKKRMRKLFPKPKQGFLKRCFSIYLNPTAAFCSVRPFEIASESLHKFLNEAEQLSLNLLDEAANQNDEEGQR